MVTAYTDTPEQAEVGHLTRNIRFVGDNSSAPLQFGGTLKLIRGFSKAIFSNIHFDQVGKNNTYAFLPPPGASLPFSSIKLTQFTNTQDRTLWATLSCGGQYLKYTNLRRELHVLEYLFEGYGYP